MSHDKTVQQKPSGIKRNAIKPQMRQLNDIKKLVATNGNKKRETYVCTRLDSERLLTKESFNKNQNYFTWDSCVFQLAESLTHRSITIKVACLPLRYRTLRKHRQILYYIASTSLFPAIAMVVFCCFAFIVIAIIPSENLTYFFISYFFISLPKETVFFKCVR